MRVGFEKIQVGVGQFLRRLRRERGDEWWDKRAKKWAGRLPMRKKAEGDS